MTEYGICLRITYNRITREQKNVRYQSPKNQEAFIQSVEKTAFSTINEKSKNLYLLERSIRYYGKR